MKRHFCFIVTFCIFLIGYSQKVKPLTIGDKIPEIKIDEIINYPKSQLKLSDLKGKLLIIDFWETYCSACIKALPHIQELQEKFKGEVQVITVTSRNNKEQVLNTLNRFKQTKNLKLPIVIHDTLLKQLFPFQLVSHFVWVGGDGVVKAITEKDFITDKNIQLALRLKKLDWPVKMDVFGIDYKQPFLDFTFKDIVQPRFLYYSALAAYLPGVDSHGSGVVDSVKQIKVINQYNIPLVNLCQGAAEGHLGYPSKKDVILRVKDENRYFKDKQTYAEWNPNNTFSYSIAVPLTTTDSDIETSIQNDLQTKLKLFFGIEAKKEKQMVECWILKRVNQNEALLKTKGGNNIRGNEGNGDRKMQNDAFGNFTWYLKFELEDIPLVIDETGIPSDMKVDMQFDEKSFHDFDALKKELQRYGLDLVKERREREMLVITEKDWKGNAQSN